MLKYARTEEGECMLANKNGFTLVEILVTLLILSFLVTSIFQVLNVGQLTYYADIGLLDLHQNARRSIYWMARELRQSSPEDVSVRTNTHIIFDTPNETEISYYLDEADVNGDGIFSQIIREYPSGTYRIIAQNISSLSFTLNDDTVDIDIEASTTALNRHLSFPLKTRAYLRNEPAGGSESSSISAETPADDSVEGESAGG